MPSQKRDQKERGCKASSFASGFASYIDGTVNRTRSLVERVMFISCELPSKSAGSRKKTAVRGNDKTLSRSKCAPNFNVGTKLGVYGE